MVLSDINRVVEIDKLEAAYWPIDHQRHQPQYPADGILTTHSIPLAEARVNFNAKTLYVRNTTTPGPKENIGTR